MKKFLIAGIAGFVLVGGAILGQHWLVPSAASVPADTVQEEVQESAVVSGPDVLPDKLHADLLQELADMTRQDGAEYSVYIDYLDGTAPIVYRPAVMRSASMIKVFILAKAMEDERDGRLQGSQTVRLTSAVKVGGAGSLAGWANGTAVPVDKLLFLMITESDNTATNMMIDLLGMERINEYIRRSGYGDTVLQRKMMDAAAVQQGRENYTSAQDLGKFFHCLYQHQCVDTAHDEAMIQLLLQQTDTECFPAALPAGTPVAHKTGELDGLYHDGGIVYGAKPYVLCILTDRMESREHTLRTMRQIACWSKRK